jgi:HEAT repeat protein
MLVIATVTIAVLAAAIFGLGIGTVFVRLVRTVRERRRAALAEGPRRALLAFVADNGEEGADDLVAIPEQAWRAAEPVANALLGKVRGDGQRALVDVFRRRGAVLRARRALRDRSLVRRARAAEVLGDLELTAVVPELCHLLDDRHPEVRIVAVRALGRIGDPSAAWRLLASLDRADPTPALLVTDALVQLGKEVEVTLSAALDHPRAQVRAVCLDALGLLGAAGTAPRVARVLDNDPDPDVRIAAAVTLGRLGARAGVPPLLDALEDDRPVPMRAAAARALGELGAVAAVPRLEALLPDPAYRVAHEAAHALRRLGPVGHEALRRAAAVEGPGAAHAGEALALIAIEAGADDPAQQTLATVDGT